MVRIHVCSAGVAPRDDPEDQLQSFQDLTLLDVENVQSTRTSVHDLYYICVPTYYIRVHIYNTRICVPTY